MGARANPAEGGGERRAFKRRGFGSRATCRLRGCEPDRLAGVRNRRRDGTRPVLGTAFTTRVGFDETTDRASGIAGSNYLSGARKDDLSGRALSQGRRRRHYCLSREASGVVLIGRANAPH